MKSQTIKQLIFISTALSIIISCSDKEENLEPPCGSIDNIAANKLLMGFSTWSFGPNAADKDATYKFISENANIYSEQIDNHVPWDAWMNDTALPTEFTSDIADRKSRRINGLDLLVSISILNTSRTDLIDDYNNNTPSYTKLSDQAIEDAYYKHVKYVVTELNPDLLIIAMEVDELFKVSAALFSDYTDLMTKVTARIKADFPNLKISESVSLHSFFKADVPNPDEYANAVTAYVNKLDYVSISFYPFFKDFRTITEYQSAFDFLNQNITKPIFFSETCQLAESLTVSTPDGPFVIAANETVQKEYLETLLLNASIENYLGLIWWAHKDYDALWATFPEEIKEIGGIWRDTGLIDQDDNRRPSHTTWQGELAKQITNDPCE